VSVGPGAPSKRRRTFFRPLAFVSYSAGSFVTGIRSIGHQKQTRESPLANSFFGGWYPWLLITAHIARCHGIAAATEYENSMCTGHRGFNRQGMTRKDLRS